MSPFININGRLLDASGAGVPPDNRAFRYGYGLFETLLFEDGRIQLEALHWQRLLAGMAQLHFELPKHFTPRLLADEVHRTVRRNGLEALCRVRLQVWPGSGGHYDAGSLAPQYIVECFPLKKELTELNENGLVAGIATGVAKSMDSLARLKSCNALIYSVAARQAKINKWNDALILNTAGRVAESSIANIFWIKNDVVYTPPLEEGCIAGVMRQHLLQVLNAQNFPFLEKQLLLDELPAADEIFVTNAIRKIRWIKGLYSKSYAKNHSRRLAEWL